MSQIANEPVRAALDKFRHLSADAETRRLAFMHERAPHDESSLLKDAREEGMQDGMEKGREEGRQEAQRELLEQLLMVRFGSLPVRAVARLAGADSAQLAVWFQRGVTASTLDAVFGPE